jgi:hypothetical protein
MVSITLQRHFRVLTKFVPVESWLYGRKGGGKAAFDVPVNPCIKSICSRSVAIGVIPRKTAQLCR